MSRRGLLSVIVGCLIFTLAPFASAQNRPDPAQFREQRLNRIKEQLGSSDDEWKVLQPKIEKIMDAQRETFAGFGGFRRGGGGGGGGADNQPQSAIAKASADLRTTLENKDAPADEIAKKLAAVREARDSARKNLQTAQKELKDVLTQRQEAVLVTMGMLE
ncbi:MAG TPA: hypothetical protein VH475_20085 [Tepidisphaeraceae bacterium]|jgi:peptidoglycan hydrolase CwlO-like protein